MWLLAFVVLIGCTRIACSQENAKQPLRLVQTIPMPNVKGRLDHMDLDVKGKRLFIAGLENSMLEVVDLQAGKWKRSVSGFSKPQGVLFVPELENHRPSGYEDRLAFFLIRFLSRMSTGKDAGLCQSVRSLR